MRGRFEVIFLEEVIDFLNGLDKKERVKIIYNINTSQFTIDVSLFKKINLNIWEFRTIYNKKCFRILAFWDLKNLNNKVVITTHGFIKKSNKTPLKEIEKAEKIRSEYLTSHEC